MKKLIALLLALAAVFTLGTSAFAASLDPYGYPSGRTAYYPDNYGYDYDYDYDKNHDTPAVNPNANIPGLLICLMEDDTLYQFVPIEDVTHVDRKDAQILPTAKRDALLNAVAEAKAKDDAKLRDAYWFEVPDTYTVDDEHYAKIVFSCKGTDVEVTVNGIPCEVLSVTGGTTYLAKVIDRGVVVVRSR